MESGRQSRQKIESQRIRLTEAISNGRLYQTKMILNDFTNLNYLNDDGTSPLMRAFMIEDAKHRTRSAMVKLLLQHKADVNFRGKHGQHVLNYASKMNKHDLVKLLLEKCLQDVDLTSQDLDGNTPLIYAVINNNVNMVRLLVSVLKKFSLSVDHRNKQDETAYLKALQMGFNECANILSKVGEASQEIKANPFLDFLPVPNAGHSGKMRVRSAPLPIKRIGNTQEIKNPKQFNVNRRKTYIYASVVDKNQGYSKLQGYSKNQGYISPGKKQGNRLFKSRKIHCEVSQKNQKENFKKASQKTTKRDKIRSEKSTENTFCRNVKIFNEDEVWDLKSKQDDEHTRNGQMEDFKTFEDLNSVPKKKERLLHILLDESQYQTSDVQQSPRSSVSYTSCNQVPGDKSRTAVPSSPSGREEGKPMVSTVNGYFTNNQALHGNNKSLRKNFPNYHSYLVWKASLDHPPNTLRSYLALRAEQHSDRSSYRKGIVIPKYDPTLEASMYDRSVGATSPVSEHSGRSEAGRKLSAVARTVGLSIYLTNKRKNSSKRLIDASKSSANNTASNS